MLLCRRAEGGDLSETTSHKHFSGDARKAPSYRSWWNQDTMAFKVRCFSLFVTTKSWSSFMWKYYYYLIYIYNNCSTVPYQTYHTLILIFYFPVVTSHWGLFFWNMKKRPITDHQMIRQLVKQGEVNTPSSREGPHSIQLQTQTLFGHC